MDAVNSLIPTFAWLFAMATAAAVLVTFLLVYLFNSRRIAAITDLGGSVADLSAKKELLTADYKAIFERIRSQKEELLRLDGERAKQEELRLELDELTRKTQNMDERNRKLQDETGQLEVEKSQHAERIRQLVLEIQDAELKKNAAVEKLKSFGEEIDKRKQALLDELSRKEREYRETVRERIKALHDILRQKQESANALLQEHDTLKERVEKKEARRLALRREIEDAEIRLQSIGNACTQQESLLEKTLEKANQKKTELANLEESLREYQIQKEKMLRMEERSAELCRAVNRLEIEESGLKERLEELRQQLGADGPDGVKSYSDLRLMPKCLDHRDFGKSLHKTEESQALQKFKENLQKEGLVFHERMINSFHTSLKCADINPLTVLAGVSGTGKTLLPIKYARLMGLHSLVMAVQPRWDSPQDMFGFYNYLEKQFKATDLARALIRMDPYHSFDGAGGSSNERMLMVLMDEMNLARTEYYFSEFLSKLELRRDVSNPSDSSDRERAEVILDLGPGGSEFSRIWVGKNVLFVGTMNEDETTQSLSDKVLDRANVLRFGKPAKPLPKSPDSREDNKSEGFITINLWESWIRPCDEQHSWSGTVAEWTEEINSALQKVGRPFGYRTEKAIRAYVANYPEVHTGRGYKLAFADQIEQKILPKLRGLEVTDPQAANCLTRIQDIIEDLGDAPLADAFKEANQNSNANLFLWHGVTRT